MQMSNSLFFMAICVQFKKARINPGQIKRPPSANRGREDAERKVYKETARADLLAKRVEQTMQKVCF